MNKKIKLYLFILVTVAATLLSSCSDYEVSFNLEAYSLFSKSADKEFYIEQISEDDIALDESEVFGYAKNSVVLIAEDGASYDDVKTAIAAFGAKITGYIKEIDFYQLDLGGEHEYEALLKVCRQLESQVCVAEAHVDLYDPFPLSGDTLDDEIDMMSMMQDAVIIPDIELDEGDEIIIGGILPDSTITQLEETSAFDTVKASGLKNYTSQMQTVRVGILDYPVDYTHSDLEVANSDSYSVNHIYDGRSSEYSHGTKVAGIIAAKQDNEIGIDGLCPSAELYSYNAADSTTAYRTAALVRMIALDRVRVINLSIAYPSEISVSAYLGNDNARLFIQNEVEYYTAVFNKLLDKGYDFIICQGAGNENGSVMLQDDNAYFGYVVSSSLDAENTVAVSEMDAEYSFFTSAITDERIAKHIIVVGSCDDSDTLSSFSNMGARVDVLAPGMAVETTYPTDTTALAYGTSVSTPFVSGVAACLYALDPDLTAYDVKEAIINSATDKTDGIYPLLNAEAALAYTGN